jgi:hypothetical protein
MDRSPPRALRPAHHLIGIGRRLVTWPVTSQHGARRNAMIAATELRQRRREQDDVEAFLASLGARRTAAMG